MTNKLVIPAVIAIYAALIVFILTHDTPKLLPIFALILLLAPLVLRNRKAKNS